MLAPGESVLLHSDGIVEAHDPDREMFGFPRLKETVADAPGGQRADRPRARRPDALHRPRVPSRRTTSPWSPSSARRRRVAGPADGSGARRVRACRASPATSAWRCDGSSEAVAGLGLEPARLERLKTAVAEATMNAMEHGNEYRADRPVEIRVVRSAADRARPDHRSRRAPASSPEPEAPDLDAKLAGPPDAPRLGPVPDREDGRRGAGHERRARHTLELVLHLEGDGRWRCVSCEAGRARARRHGGDRPARRDRRDAEAALESAYAEATGERRRRRSAQLRRRDYINSTGIALIVGLLAQARGARDRDRAPAGLSDHYREIFEITRLADFMTIVDTEDSAVSGAEGEHDA